MNRYFKNFILSGDADYHCLVCKESFQGLPDLGKHMRWEKHRKVVKEQTYIGKFRKDFIYKIGEIFYCEACNCTIQSLPEVTSHISTESHKANKKTPISDKVIENTLCQYNSGYVIVCDIILSNQQWHCIAHKRCFLCHKVVSDIEQHIGHADHVLNIIKSRIIRKEDDFYRKIDDQIFYCFTCKKFVTYACFNTHWMGKEHCENKKATVGRVTSNKTIDQEKEKEKELTKKHIDCLRPFYVINESKAKATCKTCKKIVVLDFAIICEHRNSCHNVSKEIESEESDEAEQEPKDYMALIHCDNGKRRSELSKYGKENYIKLNAGGSKGYCGLCDMSLSAHMRVFKQHVKGACHRGHLELKGLKTLKDHKTPKFRHISLITHLEYLYYSRLMGVISIYDDIFIDVPGFVLTKEVNIDKNNLKTKCFACDVVFPSNEERKHFRMNEHKKRFLAAKPLDIEGELVREIRPNVYHCAVCSKVFPFWELMEKHIKTLSHLVQRKINLDLVNSSLEEWYAANKVIKTSKNADVFYVQLFNEGILQ